MRSTLAITLFIAACGTETGNGLAIRATSSSSGLKPAQAAPTLLASDAQGTAITLTSAQAVVGRIEFEQPGSKPCAEADFSKSGLSVHCDGSKIRIDGPIVVDLMTGLATPSLEALVIPAGTYKRVDVRLEQAKGGVLDGVTLKASGEIAYRMMSTPFDLSLKFNEDQRFESAGGVVVVEDAAERLILELDVKQWFSTLPITGCLDDGDLTIDGGRIAIQDKGARCGMIEAALKDAIKASGRMTKGPKG